MKRVIAVVVILVLAGCSGGPGGSGAGGSSGAPSPGGGSTTSASSESPGPSASEEAPFVETSGECKPDAAATGRPTFLPTVTEKWADGTSVVVRHGLYANKENELFRIDVIGISDPTGASEAAIDEYSSTVKVCLDYEPSEAGGPSEGEGKPETSVDAPPFGQESLEDLIIVSAVEALLASEEDPDKVIEELGSSNPNGWRDTLEKQFQALPPVEQPYLINSIFDPKASNKATHHYAEVKSTKVWAKISSMNGSVKAGLCRGLSTDTYKTVSVNNGTPTLPVSRNLYSSSTSTWSYDLSVRGNATGLYRVALQDGWDGWYRGYFSDPPTDSKHTCTVDL